jgi:hypothetical protein
MSSSSLLRKLHIAVVPPWAAGPIAKADVDSNSVANSGLCLMSGSAATFYGDRTTDGQGGLLRVGDLEPCAEMLEDVMFELVTAKVLAEFKDCMPVNGAKVASLGT